MTAVVTKTGSVDGGRVAATCAECSWQSPWYARRTVEGYTLAERDGNAHNWNHHHHAEIEKGFVTSTMGVEIPAERSVFGVRARYGDRAAWWYIINPEVVASFRPACPRCGRDRMHPDAPANAVSRKDNETYICNACGGDEAMIDFGIGDADVWPGFPGLLVR